MFNVRCPSNNICTPQKPCYLVAALLVSVLACDARWRPWTSTQGEFTVSLPSIPSESSFDSDQYLGRGARAELGVESLVVWSAPVSGNQGNALLSLWHSWILSSRGGYFVAFARMQAEVSEGQIARLLDQLVTLRTRKAASSANGRASSDASMACTRELKESRWVSEPGYEGREVLFEEGCPNQETIYAYRERYMIRNGRLYVLTVVGERDLSDPDRIEEPRTSDAAEFFRSFRFEDR